MSMYGNIFNQTFIQQQAQQKNIQQFVLPQLDIDFNKKGNRKTRKIKKRAGGERKNSARKEGKGIA